MAKEDAKTVYVDGRLWDKFKELCERLDQSVSARVRTLIRKDVDNADRRERESQKDYRR